MGDHREVSRDSREFGCVKQNKIVGKAIVRLFPFNKIEKL
jgi:signal peptidase I